MTTNKDPVEKINEEHQKIHEENNKTDAEPGLNIGHTKMDEEKKKKEKLKEISDALGVTQQREEIDKLNTSVTYLADELQKLVNSQNQVIQMLNGKPQGTPQAPQNGTPQLDPQNIEMAAGLLDKLSDIFFKYKQATAPPPQAALIDQNFINEKMKQTFLDNLETGESINDFIKNSLKKSVTKNVINTSLKDIGRQSIDHAPA